jgi:aspartyl-tRNA(Asn)/glutamyl-tRNA(Gln) amidotransferase subunit A
MDPTELDAAAAAAAVTSGDLDPVELTDAYLARIEELEPVLNACTTLDVERARARARARQASQEVRSGGRLGPLHGVPVGVKDLIDSAGVRTTYGSALYRDHVPTADATVAARLRAAGAVLLGKHATHELARGGRTDNPHYGVTCNPYAPQRILGGSSGGSAASVVARTAAASVGTDICGSVRIPAALSGCVALKPTRGRISLAGVMPFGPVAGPRRPDHPDGRRRSPAARRPGRTRPRRRADPRRPATDAAVPAAGGGTATGRLAARVVRGGARSRGAAAVREAVDALRETGCEVVELDIADVGPLVDHGFRRVQAEGGALHRAAFAARPDAFGPDLAAMLPLPAPTPAELAESEATLARFAAQVYAAVAGVDVLVCANVPAPAPLIGEIGVEVAGTRMHVEWMLSRLTMRFDLTGLPALSVPGAPWAACGGRPGGGAPARRGRRARRRAPARGRRTDAAPTPAVRSHR